MSTAVNAAKKLKSAADEAYTLHPKSCSHAVVHVMKKYIPGQEFANANDLLLHLELNPRWLRVTVGELEKYANEGALTVGGLAELPNGHVVVVYPGKAKMAGGYTYKNKKTGKIETVGPRGPYALVMSTSMSAQPDPWPGSMSKGDKTVWDPWGNNEKFSKVVFWRFDPTVMKLAPAC